MPDFRRPASGPDNGRPARDEPSLEDILRSDDLIDALSGGRSVPTHDDTDAMLAALLGEWRDEMRWPPDSAVVSEAEAVAALNAGLAEKTSNRRSRRGLSIVGSVAAAMLCVGGFGAVVAGSGPGDSLYGLRTMFFGAPKQVYDDQVVLTTKSELLQVQSMIAQGDWSQAQDKLVALSSTVESIGDQSTKQELVNQWNQLSARVVERNPEATVPPGITFTVPPSLNELVPTAAPTTVPSMPPMTFSLPSEMSSLPSEVSSRQGTGTFSPTPNEASSVPSSGVPTSGVPTSGVESPSPGVSTTGQAPGTSVAPTSQVPTSGVPTSAAPTSAVPTSAVPTSAVPTSAVPTSAVPTSAVPTSAAPTSAAPASSAPTSVAPTSSAAQTSAAQTSPAQTSAAVTTTTPQPAAATPSSEGSLAPSTAATAQQTASPTKQQTQAIITTTAAAPAQSSGS